MSELQEKVAKSIERLQAFCPPEGYYLAFSGGKDSVVCKALLDMSGCKYDSTYRVTSVDPPELVRFIKDQHPDVKREVPLDSNGKPITMWNLIPKKLMPPTRLVRYCCKSLKEGGGDGRMVVTGVRWAESVNRRKNQGLVTFPDKKTYKDYKMDENRDFLVTNRGGVILVNDNDESRRLVESCYKRHKTTLQPIIDWTDRDVWDFISEYKIPVCGLYRDGFERIGCIGCPMAGKKEREREFKRWPKYKAAYLTAFGKMLEERKRRNRPTEWISPVDVYNWWMEYDVLPGQITFDDYGEEDNE